MNLKNVYVTCFIALLFVIPDTALSQGPRTAYFFDPSTELSWASCTLYMDGGSQQKIQFMPVANIKGAPCGTEKYMKDIDIRGPIVFIGNGIQKEGVWDSYSGIDVSDKIVMFCYDFPDTVNARLEEEFSNESRIAEAVSRNAKAVVLFSYQEEYPFTVFMDRNVENVPEIPVININKGALIRIFNSSGRNPEEIFTKWREKGQVKSEEFISKLALKIKGKFDRIETDSFVFCYRKNLIPEANIKKLAAVNEKSLDFILHLFNAGLLTWEKSFTAYFRDYDSKLFYVHHWGRGFSFEGGTFMVYDGSVPDYGLAVHENTHTLIHLNWGGSTSFMNEGIAKYAEAQAVDIDKNHIATITFLKQGELVPINDMLTIDIGSSEKTGIAYPASGSFVEFLIESYSLDNFREAFHLERRREEEKEQEDTWKKAFGKTIDELEKDWLYWLSKRYDIEEKYIRSFLNNR